jgi:hypothetical protein
MAKSLTDMAEALRWKSLVENCQDKYKGLWNQWWKWCQMMEMLTVLPHKELTAYTLQLKALFDDSNSKSVCCGANSKAIIKRFRYWDTRPQVAQ